MIVVYSTPICPKCKQLKSLLTDMGYTFTEADMTTAEHLTELRMNGIYTNEAPVLQIDQQFFKSTDIFSNGTISPQVKSTLEMQ